MYGVLADLCTNLYIGNPTIDRGGTGLHDAMRPSDPNRKFLKKNERFLGGQESDGIGGCDGRLNDAHPSDAGFYWKLKDFVANPYSESDMFRRLSKKRLNWGPMAVV